MSHPDPRQLTDLIKEKALALGFQRVGIVSAAPFRQGEGERLGEWLALGYQADMAWMVTHYEKRLNPASLMDNTRSIVCVAMNYYTPDAYDPADPQALKIAKYARGTDYHYVLKDRLKALLAYVQILAPHATGRALTDSAPILEKPLAMQAGLGWMGKNGNVILPGLGSWFFLGELLLDIELVSDASPVVDQCGRCRRCIEACPTDAIVGDGVIDANRCLSYWTIEAKDETIPPAIAENLHGWIFGCDICQDVCPWNIKFSRPTQEEAFQPRALNRLPDAETLLSLDEEAFRQHYRKSPVKRPKLKGLHRNIRAYLSAKAALEQESP
jgi:epoxyqueuosine reductase